jgi:hypothetical protein
VSTLSEATEALAAYINCSVGSGFEDADEQSMFDEDLAKARRAVEVAWLEQHPTMEA